MPGMPKYVLKLKRLSKTKTVVVFRRNALSVHDFHAVNGTWVFEEDFKHYSTHGHFKLIIHSDDINSLFSVDCKSMKIKGSPSAFGVFIRLPKQRLPIHAHNTIGCAEYILLCEGKYLPYDDGHGIAATREKKNKESYCPDPSPKYPVEVPNSVSWSVSHPFQGGKVSPK